MMAIGLTLILVAATIRLSGIALWNFWVGLALLGVGWNFAFISATTLVTECHDPHERNKVQAFNDFLVFGSMAIGSFSSGALLSRYGWTAVNEVVFPVILAAAAAAGLGIVGAKAQAGVISFAGVFRRKDSPGHETAQGETGGAGETGCAQDAAIFEQNVGAPSRRSAKGKRKPKAKPRKQTFVASHLNPDAFEGGLRAYAKYRDLGIAAATNGLAGAHVIKMIPPCDPAEVSKRHYHDVEFQMIYVLKGWIKGEYEGDGEVTMVEGSCWLQPPKIKHTVLDYSRRLRTARNHPAGGIRHRRAGVSGERMSPWHRPRSRAICRYADKGVGDSRRARAQGAVAGDLDHPSRQSFARQ